MFETSGLILREFDTWIDSYNSDLAGDPSLTGWESGQPAAPTNPDRQQARVRNKDGGQFSSSLYGDFLYDPGATLQFLPGGQVLTGTTSEDTTHHIPYIFKKPATMEGMALSDPNGSFPNIPAGHYGTLTQFTDDALIYF